MDKLELPIKLGKYVTEDGSIAIVDHIFASGDTPVSGTISGFRKLWTLDGKMNSSVTCFNLASRYEDEAYIFNGDPNKILPSVNISQMSLSSNSPQTIRHENGKYYPAEWWTHRQRFDEAIPPEGVEIDIWQNGKIKDGKYFIIDSYLQLELPSGALWAVSFNNELRLCEWRLSTYPAKQKDKPNSWGKYVDEHDRFVFTVSKLSPGNLEMLSDKIDALYEWKSHILNSKEKG